jgi:hypothetical protein
MTKMSSEPDSLPSGYGAGATYFVCSLGYVRRINHASLPLSLTAGYDLTALLYDA